MTLEQLEKNRQYQKEYRARHPEKVRARKLIYAQSEQGKAQAHAAQKRFRAAHPERERERHQARAQTLRGKASMWLANAKCRGGCTSTLEDAVRALEQKPALCQMCNERPAQHLDHRHNGPIRGWLCHECNIGIGWLERDGFVFNAYRYLNAH